MFNTCEVHHGGSDCVSGGENMCWLLNPNIPNYALKTRERERERQTDRQTDRGCNFVIFVVWSALFVGGWFVVALRRHSCFGGFTQGWGAQSKSKISCFCFWNKSRERGGGVSSRFPCVSPRTERFSFDLLKAAKNIHKKYDNLFCKWDMGKCLDREYV